MRHNAINRLLLATLAAGALGVAGLGLLGTAVAAAAPAAQSCTANVDNSGLSAAVVAQPGQTIAHRTINAAPCDIGIYVGAGVSHVTIRSVTVTGANFQGIFAQDTSYVTVVHSTITNNAFNTVDTSAPPLPITGVQSFVSQAFAVSLFGVSHSVVAGNTIYNNGRGGIGVMDNGPNDPGTITQNPSAPLVTSSDDVVTGNREWANYNGCAIVAATQNVGGSLSNLLITGNDITGTESSAAQIGAVGPDVGGIVVAADLPNSTVTGVRVSQNKVTSSFEGGVIVNAEASDSFTKDVDVVGNFVSGNNWGDQEAPNTAGIIVFADPAAAVPAGATAPENLRTVVTGNTAVDQFNGIWSAGNYPPVAFANRIAVTDGGTPIVPAPPALPEAPGHQGHMGHPGHQSHHGRNFGR